MGVRYSHHDRDQLWGEEIVDYFWCAWFWGLQGGQTSFWWLCWDGITDSLSLEKTIKSNLQLIIACTKPKISLLLVFWAFSGMLVPGDGPDDQQKVSVVQWTLSYWRQNHPEVTPRDLNTNNLSAEQPSGKLINAQIYLIFCFEVSEPWVPFWEGEAAECVGELGAAESSAGRRFILQGCTGWGSMAADLQPNLTLAGAGRGSVKCTKMLKTSVLSILTFYHLWQEGNFKIFGQESLYT